MALLLPESKKINPVKLLGGSPSADRIKPESLTTINSASITLPVSRLIVVKEKLIKVNDILKDTTLLQKKELEALRKQKEKKKFKEKEEKLEEKPDEKKEKKGLIKAPRIGFLDRIKKFIFNILLGYVVYRLIPLLPKLIGFVKIGAVAFDFIVNVSGALFNGLVTFVDWGYKAVNSVRGFIKSVGGDKTLELFDKFSSAFTTFVNGALIVSMIMLKSRGLWKTLIGEGAKKGAAGILGRGIGRAGTRLGIAVAGKAGGMLMKGTMKTLSRVLQKIPIIGGLIDFGINIMLGEDPGRAAARAVGSTAGGALGGLVAGVIGSVVPFAGTALGGLVGSALGGWMGDWAGGALYDAFVGAKKMAKGGVATRGGRIVGGVKRKVKKQKVARRISTRKTEIKPGSSIGGEEKIKKIFPEAKKSDTISPLTYIQKSSEDTSEIPFFGPFFTLASKVILGQKPEQIDYENIGSALNAWMRQTFSSDVMRTGGAFASGGEVNSEMFMGGEDLTKVIAKSVEDSVASKVDDSINELMKQLGLKDSESGTKDEKVPAPAGMGGEYSPEGLQGEIYKYLLSKGMDDNHALGIMANIHRESGFRPGAAESGGPGVGLFQYSSGGRKNAFLKAVPDYASNWKGQLDYAIKEDAAPEYFKQSFSSPQEAADWWMKKWERPAEYIQNDKGPKIHAQYIASLQKYKTAKGYEIPTSGMSLGKGYGSAGGKIAGDLGRYLNQTLVPGKDFLKVTEHPEHGGVGPPGVHSTNSYHYKGRAIDIGAYSWEQPKILRAIAQFNQKRGVKPVELLHAGNDPGHKDHVHAAYFGGGFVGKGGNITTHPGEYVIDKDTVDLFGRRFMDILNDTENVSQRRTAAQSLMTILSTYAGYEIGAPQEVEVEDSQTTVIAPIMLPSNDSHATSGGSGGSSDPYESIAMSQ